MHTLSTVSNSLNQGTFAMVHIIICPKALRNGLTLFFIRYSYQNIFLSQRQTQSINHAEKNDICLTIMNKTCVLLICFLCDYMKTKF